MHNMNSDAIFNLIKQFKALPYWFDRFEKSKSKTLELQMTTPSPQIAVCDGMPDDYIA